MYAFGCSPCPLAILTALVPSLVLSFPVVAQERVTPKESRGGKLLQELWADIPEEFRHLPFPEWKLPDDLKSWLERDRKATSDLVLGCLGDLPPRPATPKVTVLEREDRGQHRSRIPARNAGRHAGLAGTASGEEMMTGEIIESPAFLLLRS